MNAPTPDAHEFVGRADRWCEKCNKPDRDPIHTAPTPDAEVERFVADFESLAARVYSPGGAIAGYQISAEAWRALRAQVRRLAQAQAPTDEVDDDLSCRCGRWDRIDGHEFSPGCDAWEADQAPADPAPDVAARLTAVEALCMSWERMIGTGIPPTLQPATDLRAALSPATPQDGTP